MARPRNITPFKRSQAIRFFRIYKRKQYYVETHLKYNYGNLEDALGARDDYWNQFLDACAPYPGLQEYAEAVFERYRKMKLAQKQITAV